MHFNARASATYLRSQTDLRPVLGIVLGSGFQHALAELRVAAEIPFAQISGFPPAGVSGHAGRAVFGYFGDVPVLVLKGRAHYYEGYDLDRVTFPVRVLGELGVRTLLLTNAAGGINRRYRPGDFMVFEDHINLMAANPLRGMAVPGRARFVDLSRVYDDRLARLLAKAIERAVAKTKRRVHRGVYLAVAGPSYETPAEINAFTRLGADAVGMSTVPEAIVARQCGMAVAAVSCITNLAARRGSETLTHIDVLAMVDQQRASIGTFLRQFAEEQANRPER